jgi:hypothetical protein
MRGAFVHVGICKTGNSGPGARLRPAWCLAALLLCAGTAAAQPPEPVGPYAVDVRGALARFKQDPSVAAGLDVPADSLPTRGLGLGAGVHFYPLRVRRVTLGDEQGKTQRTDNRPHQKLDCTNASIISLAAR